MNTTVNTKKSASKYFYLTAFCVYVNYFVHGMGASILAQNSSSLQSLWHTDAAAVLYVISALGIGRFIALPFSGVISDKLGRKKTILIGIAFYIAFFGGILVTPNVQIAFAVALLAGIANSFLDSRCIPAVMEILTESTGLASINKIIYISWTIYSSINNWIFSGKQYVFWIFIYFMYSNINCKFIIFIKNAISTNRKCKEIFG